jgi:hypothetical protein
MCGKMRSGMCSENPERIGYVKKIQRDSSDDECFHQNGGVASNRFNQPYQGKGDPL